MTAPIPLPKIPLSRIEAADPPADPAAAPDLERLAVSLREVGLLNPPWLRPAGERYRVVTGARRVQAARLLGWPAISARLLPAGTDDFHCLLIHLVDNAYTRGFNLREQADLAARLAAHCGPETTAARYLPYLGLPPSPAHLTRLLKTAGLEPPWQELAAAGRLALTAAARLADWDGEARAAALPFFQQLHLSQSKQEEFLEQVDLLARRLALAPAAVLGGDELRRTLTDPDLTPQEKALRVRQSLFSRVYPRLSAAREAFASALARLGWRRHSRLRLTPPPAFEGPDYHLEIKFRDAPELRQLLAEIQALTGVAEFDDLTRP